MGCRAYLVHRATTVRRGLSGPAGPAGPAGNDGARGERGEKGDAAYTGRALGLWKAGTRYRAMDTVAFNGSEWRCVADDPGPLPGDGWVQGAKGVKGDKGLPGEKGERGERGLPGTAGKDGRGIDDIIIEDGVIIFLLSDGVRKEFAIEVAP